MSNKISLKNHRSIRKNMRIKEHHIKDQTNTEHTAHGDYTSRVKCVRPPHPLPVFKSHGHFRNDLREISAMLLFHNRQHRSTHVETHIKDRIGNSQVRAAAFVERGVAYHTPSCFQKRMRSMKINTIEVPASRHRRSMASSFSK